MPRKGQGRRAEDLPGFSCADLLLFKDWLRARVQAFQTGRTRCQEAAAHDPGDRMANSARYYKDAERAARWLIFQLDCVLAGRKHQEERARDALSGNAKIRKQRIRRSPA